MQHEFENWLIERMELGLWEDCPETLEEDWKDLMKKATLGGAAVASMFPGMGAQAGDQFRQRHPGGEPAPSAYEREDGNKGTTYRPREEDPDRISITQDMTRRGETPMEKLAADGARQKGLDGRWYTVESGTVLRYEDGVRTHHNKDLIAVVYTDDSHPSDFEKDAMQRALTHEAARLGVHPERYLGLARFGRSYSKEKDGRTIMYFPRKGTSRIKGSGGYAGGPNLGHGSRGGVY